MHSIRMKKRRVYLTLNKFIYFLGIEVEDILYPCVLVAVSKMSIGEYNSGVLI